MAAVLMTLLLVACTQHGGTRDAAQEPFAPQAPAAERMTSRVPFGWVKIQESTTANLHLSEYVPADSPVASDDSLQWQQKISFEAMSAKGLPDPLEFTNGWAQEQASLCDEFRDHPVFSGFENGYPTVVRLLECGRNKRTNRPLVTMIKVVQGKTTLFTVTRIWRVSAADDDGASSMARTSARASSPAPQAAWASRPTPAPSARPASRRRRRSPR